MLTASQLRAFLPHLADVPTWIEALTPACARFGITAPVRLAAFLAQVAHESAEFTHLVENMDYRAARLMKVWPKRFPTLESAKPFEHQPEKLANKVYANRNGNGEPASGDGWRFRGRGLVQLTGRGNYRAAGLALQLPLEQEPQQVERPAGAALTAAHFWSAHGFNLLADLNTLESFDQVSRRINGGSVGLAERRHYWERAKGALAL